MPPAISSEEENSDLEADIPAPTSASKISGRDKKPVTYREQLDEDEDFDELEPEPEPEPEHEVQRNGTAKVDKEDEEEDEEGDDDEGAEEYVVEKICSHHINDQGEPLFEVKWEGYEKKSDRTWEPEENLRENAGEILADYLLAIGGRDKLFESVSTALKTKKRGRQSSTTPSTKRAKKNGDHPADTDEPLTEKRAAWKPPPGSWEDEVAHIDACEDEEEGNKLMIFLTWKNGQKTQHETQVVYKRCPQKMLQFYERHVRVIKREEHEAEDAR